MRSLLCLFAFLAVILLSQATPLIYRQPQLDDRWEIPAKRSNAELINGLIGMDLGKLSAVGKRSNAELINGLLGMNLNRLSLNSEFYWMCLTGLSPLNACWVLLSFAIALLQLLALSQPEWIVNGHNIQGLWAVCGAWGCVLRPSSALIPLGIHLCGSLLFLASSLFLVPTLCLSKKPAPILCIANMQVLAASLMAISLFMVPVDMSEVDCTISQLLRSTYCRVGWAMAVSAVCCMLSICCPVLGKLAADHRKQYLPLTTTEQFL